MDSAMPINVNGYLEQNLEYVLPVYLLNFVTLAMKSIKIRSLSMFTLIKLDSKASLLAWLLELKTFNQHTCFSMAFCLPAPFWNTSTSVLLIVR